MSTIKRRKRHREKERRLVIPGVSGGFNLNEKCFFVDLLVFIKYSFRQHDERHLAMFGYREARASAVSTS